MNSVSPSTMPRMAAFRRTIIGSVDISVSSERLHGWCVQRPMGGFGYNLARRGPLGILFPRVVPGRFVSGSGPHYFERAMGEVARDPTTPGSEAPASGS